VILRRASRRSFPRALHHSPAGNPTGTATATGIETGRESGIAGAEIATATATATGIESKEGATATSGRNAGVRLAAKTVDKRAADGTNGAKIARTTAANASGAANAKNIDGKEEAWNQQKLSVMRTGTGIGGNTRARRLGTW
jgi:hypothetical protein